MMTNRSNISLLWSFWRASRKYFIYAAGVILSAELLILVAIKYDGTVAKVAHVSFSSATAQMLSAFLPQLFWSRNQRVVWQGNARVWGYADKHSISPGETFDLMLSTGPDHITLSGRVEIYRIGYYGAGTDRKMVWRSDAIAVQRQDVGYMPASIGPAWTPSLTDIPTKDWRSGYYAIDFVTSEAARVNDVAYIVVTNQSFSGDILVKLSTSTYQAYNKWGGHSLYENHFTGEPNTGRMVSFDRPTQTQFYKWEYYYVLWLEELAEKLNLTVDYATDFDVHREPRFTDRYTLFISLGHSEYWSNEEFDNVYRRIFVLGKNTMFLGANIAYWQVRYADLNGYGSAKSLGRQMICYKSVSDPVRYRLGGNPDLYLTTRFRDEVGKPETMLMGVGYCLGCWFRADSEKQFAYRVNDTNFPFFKGTGYSKNEPVGDIVGYEWDNSDPAGDGNRFWKTGKARIAPIPKEAIRVVLSGTAIDYRGRERKAEAVYFVSKAGAKVFSAGTIRWPWALGKKEFQQEKFRTLNRNLTLYFLNKQL
jgi:N,N-dimethylformamidase beta subunit-like, C-terminal